VQVKRKKTGDPIDLGDEYKGAVSDAFKKACQQFGVALYLARSEDALSYEQEAEVDPVMEQLWENLVSHSKKLDNAGRAALNEFWVDYSGGRPKPKNPMDANKRDLEALVAEAVRLHLGGEYA
jgi:hypothetical protein